MGVLGFLLGLWVVGIFIAWFPFWLKRTDRSQSPLERRMYSFGHAAIWPIVVVRYFMNKQQAASKQADLSAAEQRILGNAPPSTPPSAPPASGPTVNNPFDTPDS